MLTDSITTTPSFSFDPTVDDFFNLDILNSAPSAFTTASSSSSSPRSPFTFSSPNGADDDFFAQFLDTDELTKGPSLSSLSVPSYDFFGATQGSASASGSSPESIDASTPMFAIDPQLVGTPATSNDHSDQDSNSDEELEPEPELAPPKRSRRGAVASGGIKKSYSPSEKDLNSGAGKSKPSKDPAPLRILEPEDWRPSPEEYKKMSSREKRQLRNKISARNFRVRRKEYITTLEGDIAERDRLIDAIRSELGSSRSENTALRQEISALKRCLLDSRNPPDLPPPAELQTGAPLSPPGSPTPTPVSVPSTTPLITPNTQKDLPTSPRLGARPFWGGFGGMGVTPVHTTLIPPVGVKGVLQENINPALHCPGSIVEKTNSQLNGLGIGTGLGMGIGAFDAFADTNPFTLKTLDAYRMQLWGKMAAQHAHANPHGMGYTPHGLASGLKPAYFASPPSSKSQGLGGKNAYPSPPSSPGFKPAPVPTREQAAFAAIASQTLLGKLGSAFWEAFSGSGPGAGSGVGGSGSVMRKDWDAEKVRKVLEGRAVVRVVDLDEPVLSKPSPSSLMPSGSGSATGPSTCSYKANVCDILEESMRSLTISKK
ncbi:uncharacterized protein BJ212DRAFT_1468459 [Suillus subaureus]|uniref:BZIP domain-containing protein n=1 Tax=Suillus subaureus TaxID=48587 RepID=A0A9P7DZU9_9AGAM|nr:uncharacterized protein BJ212DRAFT_1468459 [Suillus subaureus]KAG1807005.1 hypothetical protein BJ212DRAFT_1468459 [Suillus subaureus]